MDYITFRLILKSGDAVIIDGDTGKALYKVTCVDLEQESVAISAIGRDEEKNMKFKTIKDFNINILKEVFPEHFV